MQTLPTAATDRLVATLDYIATLTGKAEAEIPALAEEVLRFSAMSHSMGVIGFSILTIILIVLGVWLVVTKVEPYSFKEVVYQISGIVMLICVPIFLGATIVNTHELIKINTAPRLYLVEWAAGQAKALRK